jgi:hypothetical protein
MLFLRKNFEDGHCASLGLFAAPYLEFPELSIISYVKPIEKVLPLSPGAHCAEMRKAKNSDTKT